MQPSEPKSRSRAVSFEWSHGGVRWKWHPRGVVLVQGDNPPQLIEIEPDEPTLIDEKAQQHGG